MQKVTDLPAEGKTRVDADDSMGEGDSNSDEVNVEIEKLEEKQRNIPPHATGQRIYEIDPLLKAHRAHLDYR